MPSPPPEVPAAPADPSAGRTQTHWAQQGVGSDWQHRFFYWIIKHRGRKRAYQFSAITTLWYTVFNRTIRQRTRHYLDRRFPGTTSRFARFRQSYRLLRTYGQTLVDMGTHTVLGPEATHITSPHHDAFMELQQHPQGVVMLQAHVGCWQVGMSTLRHFQEKPISLVLVPEARTLSQFDQNKIQVIDPRTGFDGVMEMTRTLIEGNLLVMMGDRTFDSRNNAVKVRFLGEDAWFPVTPYRLASSTGAKIAICGAPKTDQQTYELHLYKVFTVPKGLGKKPENYAPYAQQFADCLEAFVTRYPWQFYNFYNLWQQDGKGSDEH